MRYSWPLTGRAEELGTIEAAISDPDVAGIVICGSAGVGKSRLGREALRNAASHGCETRWAVGTSSSREIPLGAFASWAPAAGAGTLRIVRGAVDALTSAPNGTPTVIGVDDVNLLDDLSTFVLHRIVQQRAATLVLTVRDRDPVPDGTRELWTSATFDRLDLQPLSHDESTKLLAAALGGQMDSDAVSRLWRLTRGNVLYLRNIVEQEVAGGRLTQRHGYWRWIGDPVLPAGLIDIIESRFGTLSNAVSDVLDCLAVGEPIELAALNRITDPAAVEDADVRGLIAVERVDGQAVARMAHPLYSEVRRNRTAPTRLRRIRGLVAGELADRDAGDDMQTAVRRAALSLDSDLAPDPDLLLKAAQGAVWLADLPLADRLAGAAIHAGAGQEAYFIRSHALSWLGRTDDAITVLADCPAEGLGGTDRARLLFLRASTLLWALGDLPAAKKLIDDAHRAAPAAGRDCLDAFLAVYWASAGKPDTALKCSQRLELDHLPGVVGAETAWATTQGAGDAGRTADAADAASAGYRFLARTFDAPLMGLVLADAHVGALLLAGMVEPAQEVAHRLLEHTVDLPGGIGPLGNMVAGRAALGAGRLHSACCLLDPLIEMFSAIGPSAGGTYYKCLIPYTIGLAIRGGQTRATAALEALEQYRHPSWQCVDHERALAHAWVAAGRGVVGQAISAVLAAAEIASARGQIAAEVMCLQTAAQFGDHSCAPRLHELAMIVEGPRAGLAARLAGALHPSDPVELDALSREFESIGDRIAAVDAAAHAAVAYRRVGRRGSAYGCAARADSLARQCGGADTPALRSAVEPLPLTLREREITTLLGDGLTNRAIADRLSLSVRTVETHIYRAMARTGAPDREQLAALLPRRHCPPTD